MKNKSISRILVLFLCMIAITGLAIFSFEHKRKKEELAQQGILAIDYRRQNGALPRVAGRPVNEEYYVEYDAIDEPELYVRLAAYDEYIDTNEEELEKLTLKDVEDYLSSEYNEDGSLRIQEGYENIRAYVDWYWKYKGAEEITEYWNGLEKIASQYFRENTEIAYVPVRKLDLTQLQELINKKNDSSYEINVEVMKGQVK